MIIAATANDKLRLALQLPSVIKGDSDSIASLQAQFEALAANHKTIQANHRAIESSVVDDQ